MRREAGQSIKVCKDSYMNKVIIGLLVFAAIILGAMYLTPVRNLPAATSADNAAPGSIHNLPVPDAVAAVRAHVAAKEGIDRGLVIIMTAFEKEWSDSCLGLGGPAESCLQVITPGWEVSAQANGTITTYRTNADGTSIRQQQ